MATDKVAGRYSPPLLLNRVDCVGTEDNITQCPRDDTHECLNTAAGVICPKGNNKLASIYYGFMDDFYGFPLMHAKINWTRTPFNGG